ncbi:MAG: GNAT family N-acetyltransferase [Kordiimonadaceae bacterium]|nr:GNAT family N-acetyltransferase [Kordiimonadaceae bacterium]MBO6568685.1 GNAT family N-acetyltransferase [Kordiimonadaceae bacterium]MBO6965339.1 GNAT family N-acetyltransferase [Kordiimonadaceae bacterium]
MIKLTIAQASAEDVDDLAPLFDAYRQFYEQASNVRLAHTYLSERLANDESVLFIARGADGTAVGFTQLYPSFCSVEAQKAWVLYDLYVSSNARRQGVAEQLMNAAQRFANQSGACWLRLETAHSNIPGQTLYEKLGWEKDEDFYTYFYHLADDEDAD